MKRKKLRVIVQKEEQEGSISSSNFSIQILSLVVVETMIGMI